MSKQPTKLFIDDIVAYIDEMFAKDTRLTASKKIKGKLAFSTDHIKDATKSFYVVHCMSKAPKDETFVAVKTLRVYVQIDIYALKGVFGGEQYLAEPMSIVLQDVISEYMHNLKFNGSNKNIGLMREVTSSPALPFEDGTKAYQSSLRYEFTIQKDYEKVY